LRRTSRKYRWKAREAVYKIKPAAISALEAKYELNMHENRRGKNEALAGYVGKMGKADAKLAKQNQKVEDLFKQGKISAEERDSRLADNKEDHEIELQELAEDFEMIPGGAPGLEGVSRQTKTFDTEAERIAKTIADDPTAQKVLEEIATRNSKKEHEVVEAVYRDPEQLDAEIVEMKKDPAKAEEAKLAEAINNSTKGRRKAYEQYAKDHGIAVEPEKLLTPEEVEAWKKHLAGRKKPEELPEDAPEKE
jgi:hypothetical protein